VPHRRAGRIVAALRPAHRLDVGVHHRGHHLQPSPDSHREQALLHIAGQPASTIDTASGSTGVIALVAFF